jgi:hypothetical protein
LGECLDNYHQAQNANGVMVSMEPVHDDYSHGCDALRTFCEAWQRGMISRVASRASEGFDEDFKATGMNSNSTLAGGSKWRQW